jgi:hypothetical protein
MGDKIKTAVEIALEKAAMLDELSEQEKEEIANKKEMGPLMADFYKGNLDSETLWARLKDRPISLLKSVQVNLLDSLKFGLEPDELKKRAKAVIAVETLKKEQKTPAIQQGLNMLEHLQKKAESERKQVFNEFKKAIENNPQARTRMVEQGGQKIMLKLSVEDAIIQNPQWKQFLADFEKNYENEFTKITQQLLSEISNKS